MLILGIDCANKSLAISIVQTNPLELLYTNVFDLIPKMKIAETNNELRTARLKALLFCLDEFISNAYGFIDLVLIEYQLNRNDKSRDISSKLLYHFSGRDYNFSSALPLGPETKERTLYGNVKLIGPSLKQTIKLFPEGGYENFAPKYASNYTANKAHAKQNFLFWAHEHGTPINHIQKKNLDDVADSFMMIMGYISKFLS